jgi:hypothetical protein
VIHYSLRAARRSAEAMVPVRIVYVDYRLIGTHEQVMPQEVDRLERQMLEAGYQFAPLAVFQAGSDRLFTTARDNELLRVKLGEIGVADGHHRLAALRSLSERGRLREPVVPVQLMPAHDETRVRYLVLSGEQLPLEKVEEIFKAPGHNLPVTTTRFLTLMKTGDWAYVQDAQPDLLIEPAELLTTKEHDR